MFKMLSAAVVLGTLRVVNNHIKQTTSILLKQELSCTVHGKQYDKCLKIQNT